MRVTAVSFVWLKYVTCVSAKIVVAKTKKENKMAFKLSKRSLARLDGVNDKMVKVVTTAIGLSKIDFGVICGLRTIE